MKKEETIKVKAHLPVETYGFVEVELEGEPKKVAIDYYKIKEAFIEVRKEAVPPF